MRYLCKKFLRITLYALLPALFPVADSAYCRLSQLTTYCLRYVVIPLLTAYCILPAVLYAQAPDTLWTKTYGGVENDFGKQVYQAPDGGYIILGNTDSYGPGSEALWLLKTDINGDTMWTKLHGNAYSVEANSMALTSDGGNIITGYIEQAGAVDLWLVKINAVGDTMWTKTYGYSGFDEGYSVKPTSDGGYIIAGARYGAGYSDMWLLKTNSQGDTTWTKIFSWPEYDFGKSVIQTPDSGYVIVGSTFLMGPNTLNMWLLRTDINGDSLWKRTWDGGNDDYGWDVVQIAGDGFLVLGSTNSYGSGGYDVWLIRTNDMGNTLWTKTYGTSGGDECYSLKKTPDGGYVMAGYSGAVFSADAYILKVDSAGDVVWSNTFDGSADEWLTCIEPTVDSGYIVVGYTYSYGMGEADIWLIKTAPDTLGIYEQQSFPRKQSDYHTTILAGPFQFPTDKLYKIFDITGRQIHTLNPAPGIYFIEVAGEIRQKVVKIK